MYLNDSVCVCVWMLMWVITPSLPPGESRKEEEGWMDGGRGGGWEGVPRGGESNKSACRLRADMGLVCEGCVLCVCVCVEGDHNNSIALSSCQSLPYWPGNKLTRLHREATDLHYHSFFLSSLLAGCYMLCFVYFPFSFFSLGLSSLSKSG